MPTYQYVCTECGGQLEAVQKFTDESLTVHEDCGGRLRKVFSPVGIVFKGSGFYKTDSRSSGSSGASTSTSSTSKENGSKENGSSSSSDSSSSSAKSGDSSSSSSTAGSASSSSGGSSGEKVA
ncbi:MAG TPA: FmdB family zinc ribbon protein [Pseudonocardia sp.]|nr:FmdB family zinc ribbon protein [Pseudonocardia sp.]